MRYSGQCSKIIMGRLQKGDDLLPALEKIIIEEEIQWGSLTAIGAIEKAKLAYFDQQKKEYRDFAVNYPAEITNCLGNISLKEGKPFIHAHITLADEQGTLCGGHLMQGTIVFACEFKIEQYEGDVPHRKADAETTLFLWSK